MHDPENRRFEYPFINCTNCGPRYTIIKDIPYDRPKTSMDVFPMCRECRKEYENPLDRRFHAQPNACPVCGPHVTLVDKNGVPVYSASHKKKSGGMDNAVKGPLHCLKGTVGDAVSESAQRLKEGFIVAVKGLGGFHLSVDAMNHDAVKRLRTGKGRPDKPFAVMAGSIEALSGFVHINPMEKEILKSFNRPIVLLKKRQLSISGVLQDPAISESGVTWESSAPQEAHPTLKKKTAFRKPDFLGDIEENLSLSPLIAPGNQYIGVMLPYTPLHFLLLEKGPPVLVMTSGNKTGEPLSIDNGDALKSFAHIADFFLLHNRDIYFRADDSILQVHGSRPLFLRRSRGYAPLPIFLRKPQTRVLACGGGLKSTVCLTRENKAFLSQYIGDLDNERVYKFYEDTVSHLKQILDISPDIIAHDLHPGYMSTHYAMACSCDKIVAVQHHHAHAVSCMAENGLDGEVIAITLDGTGLGTDGKIWGGEVLVCTESSFNRHAQLKYVPMPGGEAAIMEPWRMAASFLYSAFGDEFFLLDLPIFKAIKRDKLEFITKMMKKKINSPLTSSCGRLFDAAASIMGIRHSITFESQAAMAMEAVSSQLPDTGYAFDLKEQKTTGQALDDRAADYSNALSSLLEIDAIPCIHGMVQDMGMGTPLSLMGAKFHRTVIDMFAGAAEMVSLKTGIKRVVLSGGVFNNMMISRGMVTALKKKGMIVYTHQKVPAGDGGISLGQAVAAGAVMNTLIE